jgi:hypothetical protein
MTDQHDDFENRFREQFKDYLANGVRATDPQAAARRAMSSRPTAKMRSLSALGGLSTLGAIAAAALAIVLLRGGGPQTPAFGASNLPTRSASVTSTSPSAPAPSRYIAAAWQLQSLPAPVGHPAFVVFGSSPDGSVVLFRDTDSYDHLLVSRDGSVSEISLPGGAVGVPITVRLSPDGWSAAVEAGGLLWRYDLALGTVAELPSVPEGVGVGWIDYPSDSLLVVVAALGDTPIHPTQVWTLDLTSGHYAKLGARTDVGMAFGTARAVMLLVDQSPAHDNSGWHVYLASANGSDQLVYDGSGETEIAVSTDGRHLALSNGSSRVELVDLTTNSVVHVAASGGPVRSFSPDGSEIAVESAGKVRAYRLDGTAVGTASAADSTTWVGRD